MFHASQIKELQRRIALYDDEAAYRELFMIFYKPLLRFGHSFVRSHEVAEEIVSDVFIHIWERRQQLEEIDNLKVYLYVSTRNLSLKYLLKHRKQSTITIDELSVEPESRQANPEELLLTAEMLSRIEQAIAGLPPRCKLIFNLIKNDGLRYKEIAEILNISVKTIDNQLAIALSKIAKTLNINIKKTVRF